MTRTRLALFAFLVGTLLGACGGRSGLRATGYDGGDEGDGGAKLDGKRDGILDAGSSQASDALADLATRDSLSPTDVPIAEVALSDAATDSSRIDSTRSDSPADLRLAQDGVDANNADGIRNDGSAGRDAIDATGDGPAALTGIEIAPANPTIAASVPYTSLVVTAIYSDGTTADVTSSATFTSSDTTVIQVAGHTLTGQKAGSATITATYTGKTATTKITVSSAALTSISIDGSSVVSVGQSTLVNATGVFADGTKQDITAAATWTSSSTGLATVALDSTSSKEKITGVKAGTATISATYQGLTGTASVTITASAITAVSITPVQPILQKGTSKEFQATATYADGTTSDVTLQAAWTVSDATVASVATSSTGVVVRALAAGTATLTATVGTIKGSTTITVTTPTLVSIALTPSTWSPNVGGTQAFTATGTYSDASTADLTISATWSSTSASAASVSNAAGQKGQATALAVGTAQIQAALSGVTGSATVTVSASPLVSIAVTPNPVAIVLGLTSSLVATATYQNGTTQIVTTQVAWAVADSTIASVSNTTGQVKGLATGSTTVTATLSGKSGSATVTVAQAVLSSITVAPATATITAGKSQAFTASGIYNNGATVDLTAQVTWSSSDTTVAQASNATSSKGLATALVAGTATITATLGSVSGTATLTVGAPQLSSIMISPTSASVSVGENQAFTATAVYENGTTGRVQGATWTSSNTLVATMGTQGPGTTATGVAAGTTTITVTFQGKSASATLTVTAATTLLEITVSPQSPASILVGATQQFQATAIYSDGTTSDVTNTVSWTTSDANVASISNATTPGGGPTGGGGRGNAGLATGVGAGTVTITASYAGTCTGSCTATSTLTVRDPIATGLTITPASASVKVGGTQQFTAMLIYDDGTSKTQTTGVSWTTSDGTIASISSGGGGPGGGGPGGGGNNAGLATGVGAGTAKITATYGTFTATASLAVTAATAKALVVTPATASIVVNATQALVATLVYDDGTTSVVTASADWTSSDAAVATVTGSTPGGGPGGGGPGNGGGTVTALAIGTATITATYSGLSGTATLTVTDPPLSYIQVTPTNQNLPVGASQQLTATAVFADFTTRNVTASPTWASSNTSVAVVTGTGANAGRASALAEGSATITATYDGISGTTVLTVAKSVKSISVAPTNPATVLGISVSFSATATLSNDATLVVTSNSAWVSSDAGVATVTAAGSATPVKAGSATITATYLGVSGTSTLTVSKATLSSINVTPSPLTVARGSSQQLTATGVYSDSTSHDLTAVATWLSTTATVASVSNASGSRGLLTALASGSTNVTAVFQGVTSAADAVTVAP